jgi:tetratricopeptide (TPR) repeat protein
MLKSAILTVLVTLGIVMAAVSATAEVDCSLLDPRASVSTEKEGKITAAVNTLFKIAKVGGSLEGKIRSEIENLQKGVPVSERNQIKLRTLYLFCGMVANAKDINTDRKVALFNLMMQTKETLSQTKPHQAEIPPKASVQNNPQININSNDQKGGITAQNVNVVNNYIQGVPTKKYEEVVDENSRLNKEAKKAYDQGVYAFERARDTINKNRYGTAIDFLRIAAELMQKSDPYVYLGSSYLALSMGEDAVRSFKKAIELDEQSHLAWVGMGLAYKELKKNDEAAKALNSALAINPNDCSTRASLGRVLMETGRLIDARSQFEKAVDQDQNCAQAYLGLASTQIYEMNATGLFTVEKIKTFLQYLNKVLEIDPNNTFANEMMALYVGERQSAAEPTNADAKTHLGLAERWFAAGRYKEALAEYEKAEKFEPNNSTIPLYMGDAYFAMGQWDKAIQLYKHSADIDPMNFRSWRFLGDTYERMGQLTDAKVAYEKALQINPDYLLAKGDLYRITQKIMKAR